MLLFQESQKRLPSQEHLFLDYVHRLEKHKAGRRAVHIHLSGLRPFNRREHHIRIAANNFETLIKALVGQLFVLKGSDLVFIYKGETQPHVETAVQQVRFLFSDDPLLEEETDGRSFATWYRVDSDFDEILHLAQGLVDAEQGRPGEGGNRPDARTALKARQDPGKPFTPEMLGRVEAALARADLSNLVRRQSICIVDRNMVPEEVFSELFISIRDLRETLLPGVNLLSNRWLFQHLTETLDKRMLAMLSRTDTITVSGDISFNLNVSTLLSPEFTAFDDQLTAGRRGVMIIEVQVMDIFSDLNAYLFAREFMREKGYRVCLDGLTYHTMSMIDRERVGADLVKLLWHPELVDGGEEMHEEIRAMVGLAGESRVVLCRVDDREAVHFGQSVGITLFQGRYVETLIAEDNRRREILRLKTRIDRSY